MEIRLTRHMTLRQRIDELIGWYGSEANVLAAAERGDPEAQAGLLDLALLHESPGQLDVEQKMEEILLLEPADLAKLTPARWALMEALGDGPPLAELGRRLGRDKKNISDDVRILERMGLLRTRTEGRTKRVWLRGDEVILKLPAQDEAPAS